MRIGIVGAGIAGLSGALALARNGHHVEVFESCRHVGGLASTFDFDGVEIERYYHFLCTGDTAYLTLCRDLGLADRIRWAKPATGFHYDGRTYGFTGPADLLRFAPVPFAQRIRFGLLALESRRRRDWRRLDGIPAASWLTNRIGRKAYDVIWHPLLALKFGDAHRSVSAAWVWHRLHRIARSKGRMGYLAGGNAMLFQAAVDALRDLGATVHTGRQVTRIHCPGGRVAGLELGDGRTYECQRVLSTIA